MTKSIKIAIVGCGYITQAEHVPALLSLQPEIQVVAAVDSEIKRATAIAAPFSARNYSSMTEALTAADFEAAMIFTPAPTHAALIAEAAEAGKDILVEKPLAYSLQEARQAITAVEDTGVKCMVAYHRRYDDDCLHVKKLISEKAIGEVRAAVSLCRLTFPSHYKQYADVGSRPTGGKRQDLPADWLTENSIHHINLLRFWLGDVKKIHSSVYRDTDHNLGMITLEFEKNILASHHQLRGMECGEEITVYGTLGNIRIELWYPHRPYRFPRVTHFTVDPPRWSEVVRPRNSPYTNEITQFMRYIKGEADMWSDLADSYRDLEIMRDILARAVYVGPDSGKERK